MWGQTLLFSSNTTCAVVWKMINISVGAITECVWYLSIYNGASWRLLINVTLWCICGRCNLAYLVPLSHIHMIRIMTRSRFRKWSKPERWLLLWRTWFKSITRYAMPVTVALKFPFNRKHLIFLHETCCWHIAENHVTAYHTVRYWKYVMLKLSTLSLRK